MDTGNINAVEPDFIVIALKCITGLAVKEEKTRLGVLLKNPVLMREYEELKGIVNNPGTLLDDYREFLRKY
jgi:hypothetical protein